MTCFPHPLPPDALRLFCRPTEGDPLHSPVHTLDGTILAGNGYVAVKATSGHWHTTDFPLASPAVLHRFGGLPWARLAAVAADKHSGHLWLRLDDIRSQIHRAPVIRMLRADGGLSHSPIVTLNSQPVFLSFIQAIARLPGAEFFVGNHIDGPLFFRGSRWSAIIPAHAGGARLPSSRDYFRPPTDAITRDPIARELHPRPNFGLTAWPPAIDPDTTILDD